MSHGLLSSWTLILCFFALHSSCIRITRVSLPSCEVLRLKSTSVLASQRSLLYLPSPLSITLPPTLQFLDDDHFCSQLADLGCTVYALDRAAEDRSMPLTAEAYETAISQCLTYIRNSQVAEHCTVVTTELSSLHLLNFLSRQENERILPSKLRVVLIDPPPLHPLYSEPGRRRILDRFRPVDFDNTQQGLLRREPVRARNGRGKKRSLALAMPPLQPPPRLDADPAVQQMWVALESGALSTVEVLGERMPAGAAAVAGRLGIGGMLVISTEPPYAEVGEGISSKDSSSLQCVTASASEYCMGAELPGSTSGAEVAAAESLQEGDCLPGLPSAEQVSALCAGAEEALAAQDRWGAAAVEEVAAMYDAVPVTYLAPLTAHSPTEAPAGPVEPWSESEVQKHKQLTRVLSLLMGL